MGGVAAIFGMVIAALVLIPLAVIMVMYVVVPVFKGIGWIITQLARFIGGEVGDLFRLIGAVITSIVFVPLVIGSIVIGRWSASAHYGRAVQGEIVTASTCIYRMLIGHPARLLCLTSLTEGIEKRVPEVVAATPGRDKPRGRAGKFDGYTIVGSLPGGGSGGKLYVAEPDDVKLAGFARNGQDDVGQVVIKSFSLDDGSSLPQIVRESRSLDAAKKLGLVLDHELTPERFHYVMRYVPGESLSIVTQRLHADSGSGGLDDKRLRKGLGYIDDLVSTLETYHRGGLWHKDVKPDNIIVDGKSAHLVDFGLLSSLRSSMTLTTHGTEYFRDPEMVRMALKGVKVHEVNGAKFDIYAAGAVLFSVIENSFPAHGGLSQITKRCPESLRWVVRRAMTDYDKRYESTAQMLADLRAISQANNPFAVKPAELPSMSGKSVEPEPRLADADDDSDNAASSIPIPPMEPISPAAPVEPGFMFAADIGRGDRHDAADAAGSAERARPKLKVANWWTGRYEVEEAPETSRAARVDRRNSPVPADVRAAVAAGLDKAGDAARWARARVQPVSRVTPIETPKPSSGHPLGLSAREQVERARARAAERRRAVHERAGVRNGRRHAKAKGQFSNNPNAGVAAALFAFLAVCVLIGGGLIGGALLLPAMNRSTIAGVRAPVVTFRSPDQIKKDLESVVNESSIVLIGKQGVLYRDPDVTFTPELEAALARLEERGIDLIGFADDDNDERAVELVSQFKVEKGLAPFGSVSAEQEIGRWLTSKADLSLAVWIAPDPDNPSGEPKAWLVPSGKLSHEEVSAAAKILGEPGGV